MKLSEEGFEFFITADAQMPPLGLRGRLTGLLILKFTPTDDDDVLSIPGLAGLFELELSAEGPAELAGIEGFSFQGRVRVMINTTLAEQVFEVPESFLAVLPSDFPPQLKIFESAPSIDGEAEADPDSDGSVYFAALIAGSINLFDVITLSGQINITVASDRREIAGAVSTNVQYIGSLSGSIQLIAFMPTVANPIPRVVGRATLSLADGGAIPGVELTGDVVLEVNVGDPTGGPTVITSFLTEGEVELDVNGDVVYDAFGKPIQKTTNIEPGGPLVLNEDDSLATGMVEIPVGLRFIVKGHLRIGPVLDLEGRFVLSVIVDPFVIEVEAKAKLVLGPLGELTVIGALRIDGDGLVAHIEVDLQTGGFGEDIGIEFRGNAFMQINTSSVARTLPGVDDPIPSGFKISIEGELEFLGLVTANGSVTIALQDSNFTLEFDVEIELGPFTVQASGGAGIYNDLNPGLVLRLGVQLDVNIFEIFKIEAGGELQLNTTHLDRTLGGVTIGQRSFRLALDGEINILDVVTVQASFFIQVGGGPTDVGFAHGNPEFDTRNRSTCSRASGSSTSPRRRTSSGSRRCRSRAGSSPTATSTSRRAASSCSARAASASSASSSSASTSTSASSSTRRRCCPAASRSTASA